MEERSDQMMAELINMLLSYNERLVHMDNNFLLNNAGDVHGVDRDKALMRITNDEEIMTDYFVVKSHLIKGMMGDFFKYVKSFNMAFTNEVEQRYFVETLDSYLSEEVRNILGRNGRDSETHGYGRTLCDGKNDADDMAEAGLEDSPMEPEHAIEFLVKESYASAQTEFENDKKQRMVHNFIGKRVYMRTLVYNDKLHFNIEGTLKSVNGNKVNVDAELEEGVVNTDIRSDYISFTKDW